MARTADPVKALEKALEQLKKQESAPASSDKVDSSALIKETRKFADDIVSSVQSFLSTIDNMESGNYAPKRRGGRKKKEAQ
jgi:hypothetical protein